MDYLREHVKRYWGMAYRRTLGISLVTASMVLVIGIIFNILTQNAINANYLTFLIFWTILVLVALFVALSSFFTAHVSSVKLMDEEEYAGNSRRMALWMISLVAGVILFLVPIFFVTSYFKPIYILFAFGGILLVLYTSIAVIFKHSYRELVIGTGACWFMLILGIIQLSNTQLDIQTIANFNLYFAVMSIMIISTFIGIALLFNSANESNIEFMNMVKRVESNERITKLNKQQINGMIKDRQISGPIKKQKLRGKS